MPIEILVWTDLWSVPPVDAQPRVQLTHWRLIEVSEPGVDDEVTLHAVGYSIEHREGRVTSPVTRIDGISSCVLSKKGRVYQLEGPPGTHPDAQHVLNRWVQLNGVTVLHDVSGDFVRLTDKGLPRSGVPLVDASHGASDSRPRQQGDPLTISMPPPA